MTRQDYILIADVLADQHRRATSFTQQQTVVTVAQRMCSVLAETHPNFDPERFMDRCIGY